MQHTRDAGRRRATRLGALALGTALVGASVGPVSAATTHGGPGTGGSRASAYTNPVSKAFADTFADPSVIRGKDGWWYAFGTSDPLREGEGRFHRIPISRSRDLVNWRYVTDAFTDANLPRWAESYAGIWAPDIRYVNGQYRLYYVVTETKNAAFPNERNDNAVGVATAPTPTGPWTDSGDPVVDPRRGGAPGDGNFKWTFDPNHITDTDGTQYLFYGSYYGGIFVSRLNASGTEAVGAATMVAIDNKFEGAYVVRRGGYWYLFASTANCCAGPTTGYSVHVGRSRDLRGPYLDREGTPLTASRAGGTPVIYQNGNKWIGAGHNAVVTDLAGQDWALYHAIDRADPYLDGTNGINERPMLLDRLDWVGGWPVLNAGAGPSATRRRGPVTGNVTDFSRGIPRAYRGNGWRTARAADAGRYARSRSHGLEFLTTRAAAPRDVRVEADLRQPRGSGRAGLVARYGRHGRDRVAAYVDARTRTLTVEVVDRGRVTARSRTRLPAGYRPQVWHSIVLTVRAGVARAEVSDARLDVLGAVRVALPRGTRKVGKAGALATRSGVGIDNLSVNRAHTPVRRVVAQPRPGRLLAGPSDEFNGARPERGWSWVRRDRAATTTGGVLRWPVQSADLTGTGNNAAVLLRRPPAGNWTVETKLSIDLGTTTVRNFQQGGLVAYVNDDLFTRLSHVAIFNTRQNEFGKEMPYAGRLSYGGTIIGPPAATTWLRIVHRTDRANGEHELTALTSRNGRTWVRGGTWTLPAGSDIKVGLVSHGNQGGPAATSEFDYFRVYDR